MVDEKTRGEGLRPSHSPPEEPAYCVWDGRWFTDPERATLLGVADTVDEFLDSWRDHDAVLVEFNPGEADGLTAWTAPGGFWDGRE